MPHLDWQAVFDEVKAEAGASEEIIRRLAATVFAPISSEEAGQLETEQINPFPTYDPLHATWSRHDPRKWSFPKRPLPQSYLDLLRWSDGAWCRTGNREFGFFPALDAATGLRAMMLAYHVPEYMPLAVPFAFNGGGTFYLFDMRKPPVQGEYPVVCCGAGALGFDNDYTITVADSLWDACTGHEDVDALRFPEPEFVYVDLVLTKQPPLKLLATLKKLFNLSESIAQLKTAVEVVPVTVTQTRLDVARFLLADHADLAEFLAAHDQENAKATYSLKGT